MLGLVLAAVLSARVGPPPLQRVPEQIQQFTIEQASRMQERMQAVISRFQKGAGDDLVAQPSFAGCWRTDRTENLDTYLMHMGVGPLKRAIATKASQQQCLRQIGSVVELKMTDKRGTMLYEIHPDNKWHTGKGFMKLPMKQRAKWDRDGSLLVEERYFQHLGGDFHLQKCSAIEAPVILSRRFVDKDEMLVQIQRTLASGEVVSMTTWYSKVADNE